ncbi:MULTISPECIES: hypothetical protein [Brevibacillus]|uniref:Uncharacterized protein n=1 Tax=Brevibacillus invocatus TaxID=173959 RepID=A0A3M8CGE5_9BACL|nr:MULTISPECIES: hypothetical protein [Brevibacillus]MCM3079011.1 hypothetical protein [Brevibacillus invocatus]MCM3432074.1 hypothetical protein [Brevibacillus invocatus]MDH4617122.1 hypothetical protein [Brevibacillus sp. AY1]RNB74808.1 hypothetical protein EDM52_08770 [Brevibacillus invocatus]
MKFTIIPLTFLLLLDITSSYPPIDTIKEESELHTNAQFTGDCDFKIDEYNPALKWNNLRYKKNYESDTKLLERGEKIGEVQFKVNGNVCLGYRMENGDATWAPIGTPIYKIKGYSEKFRLLLGDELFEVSEIPDAKKIGDFYDITGKVMKISIEYPIENSPSVDFSMEETIQFIDEYLQQDYVPFNEIFKGIPINSNKYFLRVHLNDDSKVIIGYWIDENAFLLGYGNDVIKNIVTKNAERLTTHYPRTNNN